GGGSSGHADFLSLRAELHLNVVASNRIDSRRYASCYDRTEASGRNVDFVGARQHVTDGVAARAIGFDIAGLARLRVNGLDFSIGNHRATWVGDYANDRAVESLGASFRYSQHHDGREQRNKSNRPQQHIL